VTSTSHAGLHQHERLLLPLRQPSVLQLQELSAETPVPPSRQLQQAPDPFGLGLHKTFPPRRYNSKKVTAAQRGKTNGAVTATIIFLGRKGVQGRP